MLFCLYSIRLSPQHAYTKHRVHQQASLCSASGEQAGGIHGIGWSLVHYPNAALPAFNQAQLNSVVDQAHLHQKPSHVCQPLAVQKLEMCRE